MCIVVAAGLGLGFRRLAAVLGRLWGLLWRVEWRGIFLKDKEGTASPGCQAAAGLAAAKIRKTFYIGGIFFLMGGEGIENWVGAGGWG